MASKCPMCGAPMQEGTCGYCGYAEEKTAANAADISQQPIQPQIVINSPPQNINGFTPGVSRKSKSVALILCIFLGYIGAHKFYVGENGMGIIYLFTMGLFGIGWLIDIILIAAGSFKDESGLPLKQ